MREETRAFIVLPCTGYSSGVLKYSPIIIWLPFGLLLKNREYIIAIVPYLAVGVLALLAAGFAFCLVVSVVRWGFIGARGTYLVCKNIIKAFMPVSGGNSHEKDLDEEPHQSEDLNPYQTLGVEPGLSSSELNARYRQLISANHPDKVAQLDPEITAFPSQSCSYLLSLKVRWSEPIPEITDLF